MLVTLGQMLTEIAFRAGGSGSLHAINLCEDRDTCIK